MTTSGRVEYHFLVFGGLSLLVIEVKYVLGSDEERLNAIAQVIAECDGTHYGLAISLARTHTPFSQPVIMPMTVFNFLLPWSTVYCVMD